MSGTTGNQERVSVLDLRLALTQQLTENDRNQLTNVSLPVLTASPGKMELGGLLAGHRAFGAIVLDGIVIASLRIGRQTGIRLLGPGDLLVPEGELWPGWLSHAEVRARGPVRLALFGTELQRAAHRSPRIAQGLYASFGDQLHRLTAQLVICQLPRVDERVLATLWLLAESWGQVTSSGVRLPLALTHEAIGALVGARRPTVTLALRKLIRQGAIVREPPGWLLLDRPPAPAH
jgi:CRP/FNR family transcriptional regulator, cyclic AMP receptor protein